MKFKYGDMVVVNGEPNQRILDGTVGMIVVADGSDFPGVKFEGRTDLHTCNNSSTKNDSFWIKERFLTLYETFEGNV
jgi:hypothetical protein